MTFKDRWNRAEDTYLSRVGRVVTFLGIIVLFMAPYYVFPTLANFNDIQTIWLKIGLTNLGVWVVTLLFLGTGVVGLYLIAGILGWVVDADFESGTEFLSLFFGAIFGPIFTLYLIVFGDYKDKWYFIQEWFIPNKIAKELLDE